MLLTDANIEAAFRLLEFEESGEINVEDIWKICNVFEFSEKIGDKEFLTIQEFKKLF